MQTGCWPILVTWTISLKNYSRFSDLTRLEIHGPAEELARLRGPLADFKPQFFMLEYGFRKS